MKQPALFHGKGYSLLLMGGHICVDMVQGGIAATLPFLVLHGGYTYAQVSMLVFAANIASAVIQPLFGWLGDKKARPWFMACGVLLAGVGMAGIGVLPAYWLIVASSMVAGIGIAMLHPEGGRLAYLVGGENRAASMSIFSVGGQVGFCIGPIIAAAALSFFGLRGTLVFLIVDVPYAVLLLSLNRKFAAFGLRESDETEQEDKQDRWGIFSLILGALSVRSVVFYGITSFVPLFLVSTFGQTEQFGSSVITVFSAAGAVATLLSSGTAKRVGTRRLLIVCYVVLAAALAVFASVTILALSIVIVMVAAFCLNLFNPPTITLGQSFLPNHLGTASGLSFGVAVCVGGVMSPALGTIGDAFGLTCVMWTLCAIAVVGLVLALFVNHFAR